MTHTLDLKVIHVLREPSPDWSGEQSYVKQDLLAHYLLTHRGSQQYFVCATPKMMDQVERDLDKLDVPLTHIHMEHFNLA